MPIRTSIEPDKFESFLISKTEQTVNTAFLWLLILKELNQQPLTTTQLKKKIAYKYNNHPHRSTFYTGVYLLQTMKFIQKTEKLYAITPKGKLILDRAIKHIKSNLAIILSGE